MLNYVKKNRDVFLKLYKDVLNGATYSPRGLEIKEVQNCKFVIDPRYPFTSFSYRNLNLSYLAAELMWYLRGDRFDLSICEHGAMWKTLIQEDGGLNSNYGQTIFGINNQFQWVIDELIRDNDSRRAVMIIGEKEYLYDYINDQRCCQYIQFMIRNGELNCYVYFRSNDVSWGVSNDVFTIVEIFKYVYAYLQQFIPNLKLGMYEHNATSMHVYEKHYAMLEDIINTGKDGFYEVPFQVEPKEHEFRWLRNHNPKEHYTGIGDYSNRILEMYHRGY